jgi:hypothetical protein
VDESCTKSTASPFAEKNGQKIAEKNVVETESAAEGGLRLI